LQKDFKKATLEGGSVVNEVDYEGIKVEVEEEEKGGD